MAGKCDMTKIAEQIKEEEIVRLRERNKRLADIAWHFFLVAKMLEGLLGWGRERD